MHYDSSIRTHQQDSQHIKNMYQQRVPVVVKKSAETNYSIRSRIYTKDDKYCDIYILIYK